ncbi:hypothetical protein [Kibdelosporangium phytohabitans]|uniref:hypothetical protein n=1 Tax=Kibdelosporangium phytohabitans TaxID=860235 RepID=UPI0012F8E746|nr:hypothetical protein [Kibdelosporangium phytohabitans]MBE1465706.1 hypothetical protein [Kibdelosporangium phytohabitans]
MLMWFVFDGLWISALEIVDKRLVNHSRFYGGFVMPKYASAFLGSAASLLVVLSAVVTGAGDGVSTPSDNASTASIAAGTFGTDGNPWHG